MNSALGHAVELLQNSSGQLHRRFIFGREKQIDWISNLSVWLEDGVSVKNAALGIMAESQLAGKTDSIDIQLSRRILDCLGKGLPIAVAFEGYMDQDLVSMFSAAEESGSMKGLLQHLRSSKDDKNKMVSAFLKKIGMPLVYLLMSVASLFYAAYLILPMYQRKESFSMGPEASLVVSLVDSLVFFALPALVVIAMLSALLVKILRAKGDPQRDELDALPIFRLYRLSVAGRHLKLFAVLLEAGKSPQEAMKLIRDNSNGYLRWHAIKSLENAGGGRESIQQILDTGLLPVELQSRLSILLTAGSFKERVESIKKVSAHAVTRAEKAFARAGIWGALICWGLLLLNIIQLAMLMIELNMGS